MLSELRKVLLAGVGAVATTYDKANELIEDMVQKGRITVDEGKELSEELKRDLKSKKDSTASKIVTTFDDMKPVTRDEVRTMIEDYEFAYRAEVDLLKRKVKELEEKIQENK
ncbi:phasin family protein [Clostridium fallax]|uniref:Poly(Hydroxyalkanoate) granule-associated protein n=1 Tax=Clostridium fallax TaxID=1533 RepID=A0A1M4TA91_9CLOT|nr:phasin family protein [Clostridium fallax]SHE41320.1 poly(hydroxyalkanoate) granule-associated protein [Clostridium fallax]SQB22670.1 Uncharacterized conserved protein [Clostridium fallax]